MHRSSNYSRNINFIVHISQWSILSTSMHAIQKVLTAAKYFWKSQQNIYNCDSCPDYSLVCNWPLVKHLASTCLIFTRNVL